MSIFMILFMMCCVKIEKNKNNAAANYKKDGDGPRFFLLKNFKKILFFDLDSHYLTNLYEII